MTNALGYDASFPGAGARDDEQRPLAMCDGAALGVVQLQPGFRRRIEIEQSGHDLRRLAEFSTKRKRRGIKLKKIGHAAHHSSERDCTKQPEHTFFSAQRTIRKKPLVLLLKSPVSLRPDDPKRKSDLLISRKTRVHLLHAVETNNDCPQNAGHHFVLEARLALFRREKSSALRGLSGGDLGVHVG